ncbi:M48 family metallopeptidase [Thiohalophilus thiocyanatoxydans]|uniref:Zn-dependent protease with chaperone function n=1 Tax=Thiohalophilus thiocyanatoxydans TaxID=381308 RepID=A0A4R8IU78_9GAMM|nr:M48 family metallopeptidase [Thiohalophilus thiocyanatoxydans]TDY03994.1 Zn-dependent protease with chaperone function [Thiohalophilus thiocyanatoxydans]
MDFFEAQDRARRKTGWLVLLFMLAVAGLILLTNLLVLGVLAYNQTEVVTFSPALLAEQFQWDVFLGVAAVIIVLVFLGSAYKTMSLSGGGHKVAEMLGGRALSPDSRDPDERRLLNVVEEMAIAAGMPVPRVYLLEEAGINAFAAGSNPNNAVIGITRGAMETLNRDELQGVIAHEFSHIFNGDMRMNIRLMGVLHGILLLALIGYFLVRSSYFTRLSRNRQSGGLMIAIIGLGIGLLVIGYVGHFFGQWIKAMVSRQREYLADASAVQFTRDKQGIAGALKKIGGAAHGSLLETPSASEYSHAYLAQGVKGFMQSLFSTHPPLPDRIKRLDPAWDGEFVAPVKQSPGADTGPTAEAAPKPSLDIVGAVVAAGVLSAGKMVDQVGNFDEQQVEAARAILDSIPSELREAAAEPFGARAVIYVLLLDPRPEVEREQQQLLEQQADPQVLRVCQALAQRRRDLPEAVRLPLIELTLPALEELSPAQYRRFRSVVQALIAADRRVDLKEWILQRLVIRQLDQQFGLRKPARAKHGKLIQVKAQLQVILSLVAHTEYPDTQQAEQAFNAGAAEAGMSDLALLPRDALDLETLNKALDTLEQLKPLAKPRLLKACAVCILFDNNTTVPAQELLRTIASCLDSPMPLLVKST